MIITGMSLSDFRTNIIDVLNATKYKANPIVVEGSREFSNNRFSVKLGMTNSRGPGSRRSASGRHGKYASYYTFWDIMAGAFHHGATYIKGGDTSYKNPASFDYEAYQGEQRNVGSIMAPAYHEELSVNPEFDSERFDWS